MDLVVTGAEKLPNDLLEAFEEKFGIRPMEGYGTTELSPVVSVNVPPNRAPGGSTSYERIGTVGKPMPGVSAKIIDLETGKELGIDEPGMLLIKGPNVMKGYYKMPEQTAKVMRDGWYVTGDMAHDRRRRIHSHHRPAEPVFEDRRRDGAAHPHRGDSAAAPVGRRGKAGRWPSRPCPTNARASG